MLSGNHDPRSLRRVVNAQHVDLDSLVRIEGLALDHLALAEDRVNLAQIDGDVPVDIALNHAGDNLILFIIIVREQALSLGLADLLQNNVLRVLDRDAAERPGVDIDIHDIADFILAADHSGVGKADLLQFILYVLNNFLGEEDAESSLFLIQIDYDIVQLRPVVIVPAGLLQ